MAGFTHELNVLSRVTAIQRTEALKATGLTGCQIPYYICILKHPGLTQDELARTLYVNKSSAARQVAALERTGFVERSPDPDDRRCLRLYPTRRSISSSDTVMETVHDWNHRLLECLTEPEKDELLRLLCRVREYACSLIEKETEGSDGT